jgi:hypothetical protein
MKVDAAKELSRRNQKRWDDILYSVYEISKKTYEVVVL